MTQQKKLRTKNDEKRGKKIEKSEKKKTKFETEIFLLLRKRIY